MSAEKTTWKERLLLALSDNAVYSEVPHRDLLNSTFKTIEIDISYAIDIPDNLFGSGWKVKKDSSGMVWTMTAEGV